MISPLCYHMSYNAVRISVAANITHVSNLSLNIFLVLVHVLCLISPPESVAEYSMNYVVPSCTLRNLKSIGIGANSFYGLVRS